MNRRFWISVVVVFIMLLLFGFLVHGMLLSQDYAQAGNLFRPEKEQQG